jgi:hypothetical protein
MRGQYAQGIQGGDNAGGGFPKKRPALILLAIINYFFPSSISHMTSGIHGNFHSGI